MNKKPLLKDYKMPYEDKLHTLADWEMVRKEILDKFTTDFYGRIPTQKAEMNITVEADVLALPHGGSMSKVEFAFPTNPDYGFGMNMYMPKGEVKGVFLRLNFTDNKLFTDDVENNDRANAQTISITRMLELGYACGLVVYSDILPDDDASFRSKYSNIVLASGDDIDIDKTGIICVWAWGLMRMCDYVKSNPACSDVPVIVFGHSRLGKTALWAGANDTRFDMVISNDSGCGGACLSRCTVGEDLNAMNKQFPHWLCRKAKKYNNRENDLPFDQHLLLALIAPRALYVASAEDDEWAYPTGEFMGAKGADEIYALYDIGSGFDEFPPVNTPIGDKLRYHVRTGGHNETDFDWKNYIDLAQQL